MHKYTLALIVACFTAIGVTYWASKTGAGVSRPDKDPPSIREGSTVAGPFDRGHHRTRFFVGGGLFGGK